MVSLSTLNEFGRYVLLVLIFLLMLWIIGVTARIIWLCRRRGLAIIKTEDGALSPSSLQAVVLLFATLIGGMWVAFTVVVTGSLELQQLSKEEAKLKHMPNMRIDMELESFSTIVSNNKVLIPLHVQVMLENQGLKTIPLAFDQMPLLLISRMDGVGDAAKAPVTSLPYVKLECGVGAVCNVTQWKTGSLGSGGKGYYSFLHPGLSPGLYYFQFQMPVPNELRSENTGFDREKPVLWTRARYFELKAKIDLDLL
jgi:hypothetical protein